MYDVLRYDLCCIGWWMLLAASVCSCRVCCGQPRSMFAQPADVGGVGDLHGGWASGVCSVLFSVAVMDIALPAVRPVQFPLCLEFCLAGISIVSVPIFVSNGAARVLFWLGGISVVGL
ncbi:hypothetical protein MtrunA17_Chr8g0392721 [Medicago truncatula]|uniref:Transmembrane protein n=1 Tax=Medicago truncatula TaxID=3880 RepID=A0A396GZ12_MEDTR|nr:hypothetical protein MtrunA17_Chr8g0392721 [Medicago truncatula]